MPPESEKKIRTFVAIKPPDEWEENFSRLRNELGARFHSRTVRWVDPAQIHLTLRFPGGILSEEASELSRILNGISSEIHAFTLRCEGLGCFPSTRHPRVLWAGLLPEDRSLATLYQRILERTSHIGVPPEDRPFKPHLTLARIQTLESGLHRGFEALPPFRIESSWRVAEVLLMRSHLSPGGARYEVIHRATLGNPVSSW